MPRAPRFYVDAPLRAGGACLLPEDSAHHAIHVLRLRPGDAVTLFNGRGGEYAARIASMEKLRIAADVLAHDPVERESPLRVTLVQGVSSGERMDFTIRKAVELGIAEIRPVLTASSVARPRGERAAARHGHWQKVVVSACEQCGRNRLPTLHPLINAKDYRDDGKPTRILLSPSSNLAFSKISLQVKDAAVLAAGPEAGFSTEEEQTFLDAGFVPASLGPRVLRTETAALAALAALSALRGDF